MQTFIAENHGKVASNRAMTLLRAMFNWAIKEQLYRGSNPAVGLKFFTEQRREHLLNPDELRRVNEALLQELDWRWRAYFPLLLMLGTRKNELLGARWADLDLNAATISFPTTKAGRSHLLPLPLAAVEILQGLPSRGASAWLFPGSGRTGRLVETKDAWQRIRQRAGVPDCTTHDLRRTFGSWLAGAGHGLPLIGRALNHQSPSATQVYARLSLEPLRAAIEANAQVMRLGRV